MMVRREAANEVGWLDEDYFLFLEETDWCFRMKRAGWKIYHCPQAEVTHLQGKSAELDKSKAKLEYYRSRYRFFRKNRGAFQETLLVMGGVMRLWVEWMMMAALCLLTFFSMRRWRKRLWIFSYLLWWHARLCPEGMGLRPIP
jgi:GT2 family glycosyltransferase